MRFVERMVRVVVVLGVFGFASYFALRFGTGGLWRGLEAAHAVGAPGQKQANYDLTQLVAVNETLKTIRDKYVEPSRVKPQQMFLSALNQVQREVAPVIVTHDEKSPTVKVKVDTEEKEFRVDNVQAPWDVAARLREVFAFLQANLKDRDVDLREVEYAACNGMLRTLDPHSVFLTPEAYREMNLSTSGHFGGLGIVISIRDQLLTIMRPMPGTPAGRSGLERFDRITKINNESTLNMPLDDAVKRLRGRPGTKVTIWVHRDGKKGWAGSRPFTLTRERINIESVLSEQLSPGVGYVRIKQFQSTTTRELETHLDKLRADGQGLKGLVLDLRGNPGGLLDQAAKVADKFLASGVVVSTVGHSEGREEKRARGRGTEPPYPIVVLTSPHSASASEIVAGALKAHDRALIVGQTTFGKGTVQLIFPRITREGAALKLTIAQYLTPGDISIQGTGVVPDIELDPMTVDQKEMDLFRSDHPLRERDLSKSLSNGARRSTDRPFEKFRYNLPESERAEMRERGSDLDDVFSEDYPIKFAKTIVTELPNGPRADQVRAIRPLLTKLRQTEIDKVSRELQTIGVDWSPPPKDHRGPARSDYEVKVETDQSGNTVSAGQPMKLQVTITNKSDKPAFRLRATTKSDSSYYDEKELIFGKVDAGASVTAEVPLGWCETEGRRPGSTKPVSTDAKRVCSIPKHAHSREDVVKVKFSAEGSDAPNEAELRPAVKALEQPAFAYTYQIADDRKGNGDGQVARGEAVTMYLTVKNVGTGKSYETQANIRNITGDGLLLKAGRFDVSNMKPGEVRRVAFTFDVLDTLQENFVKLELSVYDRDLRVGASEKVDIPVTKAGLAMKAAKGAVKTKADAEVHSQPVATSRSCCRVEAGQVLERTATFGDFTRVALGDGRFGFVKTSELETSTAKPRKEAKLLPAPTRSPPIVDVEAGSLATRSDKVTINAEVKDGDRVLDVYLLVGARKIFYQSNRKGADPKRVKFTLDVSLKPGINVITVVGRESEDTATARTIVVRRDGPNGEALKTPKSGLFGEDWVFESGD